MGPLLGALARLLNLGEIKLLLRQQIIDRAGIARLDLELLREIQDLNLGVVDVAQHDGGIAVQMVALRLSHDALVQHARLLVLGVLAFVEEVGFARHDRVRDAVRRVRRIWAELAHRRIRVGRIVRVAAVVGVGAHRAVKVEA